MKIRLIENLHWEAQISVIQAIRSITNWLYWQPPILGMPATQTSNKALTNIRKLHTISHHQTHTQKKKKKKKKNIKKLLLQDNKHK
jgi:hypothetical protein